MNPVIEERDMPGGNDDDLTRWTICACCQLILRGPHGLVAESPERHFETCDGPVVVVVEAMKLTRHGFAVMEPGWERVKELEGTWREALSSESHYRVEAEARAERAERERDEMRSMALRSAREKGEAEGRLEASEWPGIIDGWKERAERAEAGLGASEMPARQGRDRSPPLKGKHDAN